jgi:hypothetical protein
MYLGNVAHTLGDDVRATALSDQAVVLFGPLGSRLRAGRAFVTLGWVALRQHDPGRAATCFAESLNRSRDSGATRAIAEALEGWSAVAVHQGRAADAARCFGAISAFREATGAPLPRPERARHDQTVVAARSALGETGYEAAWTEGRAMTLEQAVAYALEAAVPI